MKNIDADIMNGTYKPVYLLYGEEVYLKIKYKKKLYDALETECGEINILHYSERVEEADIFDAASMLPMFAKHKVMIFEDSGFFKNKTDKLPEYIKKMPDYLIFIFVESEVDKRNRMYKAVSKSGYVAEFSRQTMPVLEKWVQSMISKEGKAITPKDVTFLLERTGDDMSYIATEVEKLICYNLHNKNITRESILLITDERIENKIFDMITAITEQRQRDALTMYSSLLRLKEPPLRILYLLARQYNILLLTLALHEAKIPNDAIASKIGVQPFVIRKSLPIAKKYSTGYLRSALEEMVDMEEAVKTGKMQDKLSIELLIIKYSTNRKNDKNCAK